MVLMYLSKAFLGGPLHWWSHKTIRTSHNLITIWTHLEDMMLNLLTKWGELKTKDKKVMPVIVKKFKVLFSFLGALYLLWFNRLQDEDKESTLILSYLVTSTLYFLNHNELAHSIWHSRMIDWCLHWKVQSDTLQYLYYVDPYDSSNGDWSICGALKKAWEHAYPGFFLIIFNLHTWTKWTLNASSVSARDQSRPGSPPPMLKRQNSAQQYSKKKSGTK